MSQEEIEITVDDLLDRQKIRENLARYCRGVDRQDIDLLEDLQSSDDGCGRADRDESGDFATKSLARLLRAQDCVSVHHFGKKDSD